MEIEFLELPQDHIRAWASLAKEAKLCTSLTHFRNLVKQGGVYLIVESPDSIIMRIGKKKFHRFKLVNKSNIS